MPNLHNAIKEDLAEAMRMQDEFEAKKEALKKRQKDPNYLNPKCSDEELNEIFGGK